MKKLTKAQLKQRDELVSKLEDLKAAVEEKYAEFNQVAEEAWKEVQEQIAYYNEALEEARTFVDEITSQMEEYYDGRSEKWLESEAAESFSYWQQDWEIDLDDVEPSEEFEPLDPPDMEHAEELSKLPEERG